MLADRDGLVDSDRHRAVFVCFDSVDDPNDGLVDPRQAAEFPVRERDAMLSGLVAEEERITMVWCRHSEGFELDGLGHRRHGGSG